MPNNALKHACLIAAATAFSSLAAYADTFLFTYQIDNYIVPLTGEYDITAWGAAGGDVTYTDVNFTGGLGAEIGGTFNLTGGDTLQILVGEQGASGFYASGGGGTFVYDLTTSTLILAAGGGGGASSNECSTTGTGSNGGNAPSGTSGGDGDTTGIFNGAPGVGGTNGNGGTAGVSTSCGGGDGGGGFLTNGGGGLGGGTAFLNGGKNTYTGLFGGGGLGSSGGGAGGGGGYSGGGGGASDGIGGGGGSYVNTNLLVNGTALPFTNALAPADPETSPNTVAGSYPNSGEVIITASQSVPTDTTLPEPATFSVFTLSLAALGFLRFRTVRAISLKR